MALRSQRRVRRCLLLACVTLGASCSSGDGTVAIPAPDNEVDVAVDEIDTASPKESVEEGSSDESAQTSTATVVSTTTVASATTAVATTTTEPTSAREEDRAVSKMPDGFGLPSDYVPPVEWVHISRDSGTPLDDSGDLRLSAFYYRVESCCEGGLAAAFGAPPFPESTSADDLGEGLYYAVIEDWAPDDPTRVNLSVNRVVECSSEDAADIDLCQEYDYPDDRFEILRDPRNFELTLDDRVTVNIWALLEPEDQAAYYSNQTWLGQGPLFVDLLTQVQRDYSDLIVGPTKAGADAGTIEETLKAHPNFRSLAMDEQFARFGVWQSGSLPVLTYNVNEPGSLGPLCWYRDFCIDQGEPYEAFRSFESFIRRAGSLHVVNGTFALSFPGPSPGG